MIAISGQTKNQIATLIFYYGSHRTHKEYGRSAFWIWIDKIINEVKTLTIKQSKKVGPQSYRYDMKYWGSIYFNANRIRINGKFSGTRIVVTDFDFDKDNFMRWLNHEDLFDNKPPTTTKINKRTKPKSISMGYTMVSSNKGKFTIADKNGNPIDDKLWFDKVTKMRKSKNGEPMSIVKLNGNAHLFFPTHTEDKRLVDTGRTWQQVVAESAFNKAFQCALDEMCASKSLTESQSYDGSVTIDEDDLKQLVKSTLEKQSAILESSYEVVEKNGTFVTTTGKEQHSLVTLSDGAGRYDICEDDGCYVIVNNKTWDSGTGKTYYVFPELHKVLKELPLLPVN